MGKTAPTKTNGTCWPGLIKALEEFIQNHRAYILSLDGKVHCKQKRQVIICYPSRISQISKDLEQKRWKCKSQHFRIISPNSTSSLTHSLRCEEKSEGEIVGGTWEQVPTVLKASGECQAKSQLEDENGDGFHRAVVRHGSSVGHTHLSHILFNWHKLQFNSRRREASYCFRILESIA